MHFPIIASFFETPGFIISETYLETTWGIEHYLMVFFVNDKLMLCDAHQTKMIMDILYQKLSQKNVCVAGRCIDGMIQEKVSYLYIINPIFSTKKLSKYKTNTFEWLLEQHIDVYNRQKCFILIK